MNAETCKKINGTWDSKSKDCSVITKKEAKDKQGWTIPKNTRLFIIAEMHNPMTKKDEFVVYVDNGTGHKDLMPKTLVEKRAVI
jgi:hypothetical protein